MKHKDTCAIWLIKSSNPEIYGECDCKTTLTHDELLAIFSPDRLHYGHSEYDLANIIRAVVEYHKQNKYGKCQCTQGEYDGTDKMNYPCETILIIEKNIIREQ